MWARPRVAFHAVRESRWTERMEGDDHVDYSGFATQEGPKDSTLASARCRGGLDRRLRPGRLRRPCDGHLDGLCCRLPIGARSNGAGNRPCGPAFAFGARPDRADPSAGRFELTAGARPDLAFSTPPDRADAPVDRSLSGLRGSHNGPGPSGARTICVARTDGGWCSPAPAWHPLQNRARCSSRARSKDLRPALASP